MRKIIEYTLASIDGVFAGPETRRFFDYRDDAYYRDGLGLLVSCDAMLLGRRLAREAHQQQRLRDADRDRHQQRAHHDRQHPFHATRMVCRSTTLIGDHAI